MSIDSTTIDRIVAGVLTQLGGDGDARGVTTTEERRHGEGGVESPESRVQGDTGVTVLTERVITAEVLAELPAGVKTISVGAKAIVTPAACDVAQERGLEIGRDRSKNPATAESAHSTLNTQPSTHHSLLIVVHHSDALARLWEDLPSTWRREFVACPGDAAKLAIAELARGGFSQVVITAEQAHRAACLSNRNERVKAAAVRDAHEVKQVRQQLRANVWCVNPRDKSWFELRQLIKSLTPKP